ncbi:MAG: 2-C-methyl-D-erythritol 2,4-cyclodiphosphate synthase [Acidobacteriota bacterium]
MTFRVGQGLDVHAFDQARPLVLAGLRIGDSGGLAGHSDGDAVLHAVTDALLGAVGAGDIGEYFPSNDPRWDGASSEVFVNEALSVIDARYGDILNVDVTIIASRPRLSPHRQAMIESLAALLRIPVAQVSVKATTTDHLGFVGREEGLCAMAVVLLEMRG